jgi:transcriptional regulator with XRE-family HTH domain
MQEKWENFFETAALRRSMLAACREPNTRPMSEPSLAFARRFKELTAGQLQADVARRLGFTASYVSAIQRGQRPSREFVERVVEAYGVDREEWLRLGQIRPQAEVQEDERLDIARRAAEEVYRRREAPPLDRIRETAPELTYDPDLEGVTIEAFTGWQTMTARDRGILEDILRAFISEARHQQN